MTNQAGGNQISFPAGLVGIIFHILWPGPMSKLAHILLIGVSIGVGLGMYLYLGHLDPLEAITRACGLAVQSWSNRLGLGVSGVDSLIKQLGVPSFGASAPGTGAGPTVQPTPPIG